MFMIKGDIRLSPSSELLKPLLSDCKKRSGEIELNLQVYIDNYSIIEYAKNYSTYSQAGIGIRAINKN